MDYSNISVRDLSVTNIEKILQEYLCLKKISEEKIENHSYFLNLENQVYQILKFNRKPEMPLYYLKDSSVFDILQKVIGIPIKNINKIELSNLLDNIESFEFEKINNIENLTKKEYIETVLMSLSLFFAHSYHRNTMDELIQERAPKNTAETLIAIGRIGNELESKIEEELKDEKRGLGFCHTYWATKKRILKEDYGIIWYSPAEENPLVSYD